MMGCSFLLAALLLCLAGESLQGGVLPPWSPLGRAVPSKGHGIGARPSMGGVKAGGAGLPFPQQGGLGFGGGPFGGRSVKAGGPHPGAQLARGGAGAGPWQPLGPQGGFGAGPGLGVGSQLGKPRKGYAANGFGYGGTLGGYGPAAGIFPRPGLAPGAGVGAAGYPQVGKARPADVAAGWGAFPGAAQANGFAPGLGYPSVLADAAGLGAKAGRVAGLPTGLHGPGAGLRVQPGKYGGAGGGPGVGVGGPQAHLPYGGQLVVPGRLGGNGKAAGYSQGLSPYGAHPIQLADDGDLGGVGQLYNGGLVVPAAQNGNGDYAYGPQALAANGKAASKHGNGGYQNGPVQPAGYAGFGAGAAPYGGKESKYGLNGFFGNGYQG